MPHALPMNGKAAKHLESYLLVAEHLLTRCSNNMEALHVPTNVFKKIIFYIY
jgi:hypothetical protein